MTHDVSLQEGYVYIRSANKGAFAVQKIGDAPLLVGCMSLEAHVALGSILRTTHIGHR